jgi:hypothetical protein
LIDLMKGRQLVEPPAATLHRARALRGLLPAPAPGAIRWLIERLFDSAASPVPVGVRGAVGQERRVLLQIGPEGAPVGQVDLLVRRDRSGRLAIHGQIVPQVEGLTVSVRIGQRLSPARLTEVGDFHLDGIRAAASKLAIVLHLPGAEPLVIDELDPRVSERC